MVIYADFKTAEFQNSASFVIAHVGFVTVLVCVCICSFARTQNNNMSIEMEYEKQWRDPFPQYKRRIRSTSKYPVTEEERKNMIESHNIFIAKLHNKPIAQKMSADQVEAYEQQRAEMEAAFAASFGGESLILVTGEPLWTYESRK